MIEQLITDHLDLWSSAVRPKSSAGRGSNSKLELTGIKKLRELILELAVRGKLVPQDPNDEPASVLLERIAAEKARLVKEGKIKKSKPLPEITDDEKPFELPEGWEWCRLGELGLLTSSSRINQSDWETSGVPFYRTREIVLLANQGYCDNELFISEGLYNELSEKGIYPEHDDIMLTGVGTIGVPYVVRKGDRFYFKDASVLIFKNFAKIYPDYISKYFTCQTWDFQIHEGSMGTTVNTLTIVRANNILLPIPPTEEQHRIVAKVDELMSLCDQLEQKSEASLAAHQTLVETLLATLTDSANSGELAQNWARLAQYFDSLFTTQSSIDALKQTILQLAVMGKLVPQDPNDEPASALLERIAAEKARLIKEGKIKKEKPLPPISEEEKPFALPDGWEWGRLADMFQFLNGYAFKSEWFSPTGVRLLRNINISHGQIKWDDEVYLSYEHQDEYERFKLEVGDVVISLDRPIINTGLKYAIIRECDLPCLLLQRVAKFHSVGNLVLTSFLPLWLESKAFMNAIDPGRSNGVPHISTKQLELTCFPILSLAEQQRIVSKVDELMSLCDQLSARLQASQTTQLHLAEALVEGALN